MTGVENYAAFVVAAIIFSMTPGIDTMFVLNRCVAQGKQAGAFSTLGIATGVLIHTLLATAGLSALLAQSATAFQVVKYLGAAYLIYLGVWRVVVAGRKGFDLAAASGHPSVAPWKDFRSGVLTNVLNPKVGIFFIAFFPQFIRPAQMESYLPFLVLGATYALIALIWLLILTWLAGSASAALRHDRRFGLWVDRISGMTFVLMGARVALKRA